MVRLLEKKSGPSFCLIAALQFLLEKAEYEKGHLILNSLQDWVVLVISTMMRRMRMTRGGDNISFWRCFRCGSFWRGVE